MLEVILDAGHGFGKEHNRGGVLFNEGDQNFKFSLLLKKELERYEGVKVYLTRKTIYENPSLYSRATMFGKKDLFISIHTNAASPGATGTEIWSQVNDKNNVLENNMCKTISKVLDIPNRGVKKKDNGYGLDWYGVLRGNPTWKRMLVEFCFHTNKSDSQKYLARQELLAREFTRDIARNWGLKLKGSNTVKPKPETSQGITLYKIQLGAFKNKKNAEILQNNLAKKGVKDSIIVKENDLWKIQVGAYGNLENANKAVKNLNAKGFPTYITVSKGGKSFTSTKGTAEFLMNTNVRNQPSTKNGKIVAKYKKGQKVNYDRIYERENLKWLSYISYSGERRYCAFQEKVNNVWKKPWVKL